MLCANRRDARVGGFARFAERVVAAVEVFAFLEGSVVSMSRKGMAVIPGEWIFCLLSACFVEGLSYLGVCRRAGRGVVRRLTSTGRLVSPGREGRCSATHADIDFILLMWVERHVVDRSALAGGMSVKGCRSESIVFQRIFLNVLESSYT